MRMDFSKFLNIVRRYFWLVVLVTLIASLTTFFVLNNQPDEFRAKPVYWSDQTWKAPVWI